MPIYMNLHIIPGVKANEVAEAHRRDMLIQDEHSCTCMTYWIDEKRGNVFCLIDAPNQAAVEEMHGRAHGLIPNRIIEVNSTIVESFLGRITDPEDAVVNAEGLAIFSDNTVRVLLVTKTEDPYLLLHALGKQNAASLLAMQNEVIRAELDAFRGREVECKGSGFVASFLSASDAVACAHSIQQNLPPGNIAASRLKMAIDLGGPVGNNPALFGDTIELAEQLCGINKNFSIAVSAAVRERLSKDYFQNNMPGICMLTNADEVWLQELLKLLEENWRDPGFNAKDYSREMAMSLSQFYRKVVQLTLLSPVTLLKEFRLGKAKALLQKPPHNIARIAYDAGFSSPSYFTKCFKAKFGLLPLAYSNLIF